MTQSAACPYIDVTSRPVVTYGRPAIAALPLSCREAPREYRSSPSPLGASPSPVDLPALANAAARPHRREEAVRRADALALSLRAASLRLTIPLARVAAALAGDKAWCDFGFARVADFARERLGRSGRWLTDLAALHESLQALPDLEAALTGRDGGHPIGRVGALLIGGIASPETSPAWVALARRSTVRELRAAVRRARTAGSDGPDEATAPGDIVSIAGDGAPGSMSPSVPVPGARIGGDHVPSAPIDGDTVSDVVAPSTDDDDPACRVLVRLPVPRAVRAAFDEGLDLFRAVEGTEATVTSFIDALVAESAAGGYPADASAAPLVPGPGLAVIESALASSTESWRHLGAPSALSWSLALSGLTLDRFEKFARQAGHGGPADLIAQMQGLIDLENEIEVRLGRLLAEMSEYGAWSRLRFSGVGHYAEERLRLSRTAAEDRARAARSLRRFPHLRAAYESGGLGLEAIMTISRILSDSHRDGTHTGGSAIERAWVERAGEGTVKRLRDEVRLLQRRAAAVGTDEHSGYDDSRPAPAVTDRNCAPAPPDDAEWHASLRREPGTARRRVLRFGLIAAGIGAKPGDALLPSPDVFFRVRLPDDHAARFLAVIESARERLSDEAGSVLWDEPLTAVVAEPRHAAAASAAGPAPRAAAAAAITSPLPSLLAARTFSIGCLRVPAWVGLLALLEEFVLTWDAADGARRRPGDRIFIRDGWRCAAPGCTSRRNLEVHHVVYRSRRGGEDDTNQSCLCRFHHQRGEHGGLASCSGTAPLGLLWRLGRRELGRWYRNDRRIGDRPRMSEAPAAGPYARDTR